MPRQDDLLISWEIPEFQKHDRSKSWWVMFIGIAIITFAFSLLSANYLFALIIAIISIIILYRHLYGPETIECSISVEGIRIGEDEYDWNECDRFWIAYSPPKVKVLIIVFKSKFKPHLSIPLEQENPLKIREALAKYIHEDFENTEEPTTDTLGRILKI